MRRSRITLWVDPPGRLEIAGWLALATAVAWATGWRLACIGDASEVHGDAFAHAVIGRRMLTEWRDVQIHWVWLPLWHVVHAIAEHFHAGIDGVRRFDVLLAAVAPTLLAIYLQRHLKALRPLPGVITSAERIIPFAAGSLLTLFPMSLDLGCSAEPEEAFQMLVLATLLAWQSRRTLVAGTFLALAVMLRYEAWLLPGVFVLAWSRQRPRRWQQTGVFALPCVAIAAWCTVHRIQTGEWLQFVRVNREFARQALAEGHYAWDLPRTLVRSLAHYPLVVPGREAGWLVCWAAPGLVWAWLRAPRAFLGTFGALLGFVTYAWARRQHLGLGRHFVVVLPMYATLIAAGPIMATATFAHTTRFRAYAARAAGVAAALLFVVMVRNHTRIAAHYLRERNELASASERRTAERLRGLADARTVVFCDVAALEVLSGLPPASFRRWNPRDIRPSNLAAEAGTGGNVLVATRTERAGGLRGSMRTVSEDGPFVLLAWPGTASE